MGGSSVVRLCGLSRKRRINESGWKLFRDSLCGCLKAGYLNCHFSSLAMIY